MGAIGFALEPGRRTGGFSPASLFHPGTTGAWYDPSDMASMFQDAAGTVAAAVDALVGRIADRSGGGNPAVQASASARPMLRQDPAGRRWLEFDGVDDALIAASGGRFEQATLAVGFQVGALGFPQSLISDRSSNAIGLELLVGSAGAIQMLTGDGSTLSGAVSGTIAAGANLVAVGSYDGTTARLHLGGTAQPPAARGLSVATTGGIGVGRYKPSPTVLHQGRLYGAIILPRTVSAAERAQIERWLAARSGAAL